MRAQVVDLLHLDHARRGELYIACEDWNFAWTPQELETVKLLRKEGAKIWTIAETVGRPDYEVAVLIMDLEERRGGAGGVNNLKDALGRVKK